VSYFVVIIATVESRYRDRQFMALEISTPVDSRRLAVRR